MFSWLFGGSGKDAGAAAPPPPPKNETLDALSSGVDGSMKLPPGGLDKFDPTVLERIATAAKELSKNGEHDAYCLFVLNVSNLCCSLHTRR